MRSREIKPFLKRWCRQCGEEISRNNITAKKAADGSVTIQFGGDENAPHRLPIMPGWNYTVRLYRPRPEVLDGKWKFPEPVAVDASAKTDAA
jgi:hypothetical protein